MAGGLRFDLTRLAGICTVLLGLSMATELLMAWQSFSTIRFFDAVTDGRLFGAELDAEADRIDQRAVWIAFTYLGVMLATVIFASVWIFRASWNARELQPNGDRITPGWAVGWFFVPFLSLWKPYQAMRQCWNSTFNPAAGLNAPAPGFVFAWWMCWVAANMVQGFGLGSSIANPTMETLRRDAVQQLIAAPLMIVGALLFIRLIKSITKAQRDASPGLASVFA